MRVTFGKVKVGQEFKVGDETYQRIKEHKLEQYGYVNTIGPGMYPNDSGHRYFYDDQIVDTQRKVIHFPSASVYYGNSPINTGDPVYITIEQWGKSGSTQFIAKQYTSPESYVEKRPSSEWIFNVYQEAVDWAESHFV